LNKEQKYFEASKAAHANSMPLGGNFAPKCGKHDARFTIGIAKSVSLPGFSICLR
jgi:hypothetical protein